MVEPHELPADAPFWLIDGVPAHLDGVQPRPQPGEAATYDIVERPSGALEGIAMQDHADRYRDLRDRARHANTIAIDVTSLDVPIYSTPPLGEFDPLVTVEPGPYDEFGTAIWGLVTGVDDSTTLASAIAQFSMDVAFLAERSDYPDKQAVRDVHERSGFH